MSYQAPILVDAATSDSPTRASINQVAPIFHAASEHQSAFQMMLQLLQARLETHKDNPTVVIKVLSLLHVCLYAGSSQVLDSFCALPMDLESIIIDNSAQTKSVRLYAGYLQTRRSIWRAWQIDVIADRWRAAKASAHPARLSSSSKEARSRPPPVGHRPLSAADQARLGITLCNLLRVTLAAAESFKAEAGSDGLAEHVCSILEQDLVHLCKTISSAVFAALAQFTRLSLQDARAALAFYARALDGIDAVKASARRFNAIFRSDMAVIKLPSSDLFLYMADHVAKLAEDREVAGAGKKSSPVQSKGQRQHGRQPLSPGILADFSKKPSGWAKSLTRALHVA